MSDGDTETDDKYDRSFEVSTFVNKDIWDDGDKYIGHSIDHKDKELNEKTQDDKYEPPYGNETKDFNDTSFSDEDIQNGSSSLSDEESSDENETLKPFENETEGTSKANNIQRQQLNRAPKGVRCYKMKYMKGKSDRKLAKLEGKYKFLQKEVDSITKFKLQMIQYYRNQQQQFKGNTDLDENLKNHNLFHKSLIKRNRNKNEVAEEMTMKGRFNEVTELILPEKIPIKRSKLMQYTISESEYGFIHILRVKKYQDIEQSIIMFFNIKTCPQNDRFLYSVVSNHQQHEHLPYNHQQADLHHTSCNQEIIAVAAQVAAVISTDHASVDLNQLVRSYWYSINVSERTRDRMIYESVVFIDKHQSYGVILIFRLRKYSSGNTKYDLTWNVIQKTQNALSTNSASLSLFEDIGALISTCSGIWRIRNGTYAFVESGSVLFVLEVMPQHLQLQEQTKQADGLMCHVIQTTLNDSSTTLVSSSLFEDIGVLISNFSDIWRIRNGTNAFVESGSVLYVLEVMPQYLQFQEPTKQAHGLTWNVIQTTQNTSSTNSVRLSLPDDIGASISTCRGIMRNASVESGIVLPGFEDMIQYPQLQETTNQYNDSANSKYTGQIAIQSTLQLNVLKSHKRKRVIHSVVQSEQNKTKPVPLQNSKRNKASKLKASRKARHSLAYCLRTRTAETFSSISNDKTNTLKTLRSQRYKTSKKQNSRSPNVKMRIPSIGPSKTQLNLSRAYLLHMQETHSRNQRTDTNKTRCHFLRKGSPYMSRNKDQSPKHHEDGYNKGNVCHVNGGIHTSISNENQMFGYATGNVYHQRICEEDICLYEDEAIGQTIHDSISGKGIIPTGIEVRTEIHIIHNRLVHDQLNHLRHQINSNRMHNVQPTMEQDNRSEICTTLTSYDKNRIRNCRPFQANFEIPLAGGTSALIVLKNTCCVDGFLLMIYVLLEENLALRTQFEHSEHDLHKIYHQIWKEFKVGNFGDGKVAWGKYGGYIADIDANGAKTEKIIDIIGTENERIFCVLGKHRFPLRIHCSLVNGDVYFTTQLYNVLPVYEVPGEPLCDTIKRAINKYLKRDDLPCYSIHGIIKEECRGNSVQTLVEPPLILPINLFFLKHGKKKHSSAEIPEIVESNEHRYELYLVRFFMDGINHFVDKIKIHGTWTFYDDCREKLYHFDVEPESVQLSSCYFVKV
ncbi:uncharacterized protein LOC127701415 [Mytilus californianus]|uniref:uncharacterized protein LOC127701415 n=1 Tax=Mytilus californianus TaxID=6549 RepID=UPI002246B845|nr:uncharacterized protein LOC127701415 [Mytilus californianus]